MLGAAPCPPRAYRSKSSEPRLPQHKPDVQAFRRMRQEALQSGY